MSDGDWPDPFSDDGDDAARERARRRAEREERRRDRRRKLADKVRASKGRTAAPPQPEAPTDAPPPLGPPEPSAELAANQEEPGLAVGEPPASSAPPEEPPGPPDGEPGGETELSDDEPPARHAAWTRGGNGAPAQRAVLVRRRLLAIGLLVAAVALVAFGAGSVVDQLGGSGGAEEEAAAPAAAETISVTIPEGLDRRQIAAVADEAGLRGNYMRASREARGFNPGRFGADGADSLEGFLFPATYELERGAHVNALVQRQLDAFREQVGGVNMRQAESRNLTVYDVLKIASMIEREVQVPRERKLVSAVIYNRLADGSPLGIDATIRYEDQNYDEPLTESRLAEATPYNTRVNAGLPPTPIGNPGLDSIEAAAQPADVDHFYYVVKPNTCGEHFFTASAEEFENAVAEYQAALEDAGGAPTPEDC